MTTATLCSSEVDVELRLVDPTRNCRRIYGLTECRTLFGEMCLRIQWGRIGRRRIRERSETFADAQAQPEPDSDAAAPAARPSSPALTTARAMQRDIVEAHGLSLRERSVQQLVDRWHDATSALARYLEERRPEHLDLVDVSTLAAMYVEAQAS